MTAQQKIMIAVYVLFAAQMDYVMFMVIHKMQIVMMAHTATAKKNALLCLHAPIQLI